MTASAKNDTPRTDAIVHNGTCVDAVNKYREISRQLETEVQELRAALEEVLEDLPEHNQPKTIQNATYAQARAALAKVPK